MWPCRETTSSASLTSSSTPLIIVERRQVGLPPRTSGYGYGMTTPEENVTPEPFEKDDDVLAPATPGAQALPLPDDEVDKPSDG